jgi:5,5'-dehydrodivanillate O-demethylase oxygenase subunit
MVAIEPTETREHRASKPYDFAHTGPDTLAGRYLRMYWQPVMKSADLEAGHAKPITIMSEHFTLYRGEDGTAYVVAPRCAHRGTQLSTGWVEGDCIRCFYHGWKYDGTGQCVEMPAEDASFPPKVRIRAYPTQEYLGLIFAYLGEGEAPPLRRIPQLDQPGDAVLQTLGGNVLPFNYVNNLENDPAHVPFVHRSTDFFQDVPQVESVETEYGSCESVYTDSRGFIGYVHRLMPNTRLFTIPVPEGGWAEFFLWLVPVDDEHHMGFGVLLNHLTPEALAKFRERGAGKRWLPRNAAKIEETAAAVLRGDLRIEDVEDRTTIELVQDMVSQWGQGVIRDREHERLGRSDKGLILLRGLFDRELRALDEGRPLKEWTIPAHLELSATYHG